MMMCAGARTRIGASVLASGDERHQGSENSALKKIAASSFTTRRTSESASIDDTSLVSPSGLSAKKPLPSAKSSARAGVPGNGNGLADNPRASPRSHTRRRRDIMTTPAATADIDARNARLKATWMDGNYDYCARFRESSAAE